jgi:hypothetical protein
VNEGSPTGTLESNAMRLLDKFYALQTRTLVSDSAARMRSELASYGITFEGDTLPVSLMPTIVPTEDVIGVAEAGRVVRRALNQALSRFVREHEERRFDGPMHRFFSPYYRWWDLIAAERRQNEPIQLMRFDAVLSSGGRWQFMETNADCPGGTIHCARVRHAWLNTDLGQQMVSGELVDAHAVDDPGGFVRFLAKQAKEVRPEAPNIAILNYRGRHTNELASLQKCHAALREKGEIEDGELVLGDLRELTRDAEDRFTLGGVSIALIYNKLPAMDVDPSAADAQNWVAAAESPHVEFLNSVGATYLAEAKRSLALLSDPVWRSELSLTHEELAILSQYVPFTRLLEDSVDESLVENSLPIQARRSLVLKADRLTRGKGVFLGDTMGEGEWLRAPDTTRRNHGVIQAKCDLPSRTSLQDQGDGSLSNVTEYYGVDVFYFGDDFAGLVSRSHTDQVFNVGNGGRESVVLIAG